METNLVESATREKEDTPSFPEQVIKLTSAAVALFGASSVLYGIGFLALRSHYSFLGVWGGIPVTDTEIVEEAGRFIYNLLYATVTPITAIPPKWMILIGLPVAGLAHLLRHFPSLEKRLERRSSYSLFKGSVLLQTLFLVLALAGTAFLLNTIWDVPRYHDVLYSCDLECRGDNEYCLWSRDTRLPADKYVKVVWGSLSGLVISWTLYHKFWPNWPNVGWIQRTPILAQWVVVAAALGMLPLAYGRLMLPFSYPAIDLPNKTSEKMLLLSSTSSSWVVWNVAEKKTEVLPRNDEERVTIGVKESILP